MSCKKFVVLLQYIIINEYALVAQLDRASASDAEGYGFDPRRVRHDSHLDTGFALLKVFFFAYPRLTNISLRFASTAPIPSVRDPCQVRHDSHLDTGFALLKVFFFAYPRLTNISLRFASTASIPSVRDPSSGAPRFSP